MKNFLTPVILFIIVFYIPSVYSQGYHVRIGTIGNSITHGVVLDDPEHDAYPAQLHEMLKSKFGDTCIVRNFGLTTTTMLKNGDVSYWDTQQLKDYLAYAPEICLILLGTNDTKPQNWDVYGDEFIGDYLDMIDTILQRNPSTKFLLCYPPPAFEIEWGINDSVIVNGVIPAIDSVLKLVNAKLNDFYTAFVDSVQLFPDNIHPNVEGNTVMAQIIMDSLIATNMIHEADTGLTFITGFYTSTDPLAVGDSAELSWTSINADSVKFNEQIVADSGSTKVAPSETTVYELIAFGDKSIDTVKLTQEVYTPVPTKLIIQPVRAAGYPGDTVFFIVKYYDQINKIITKEKYPVEWSVVSGTGYLINESDTSVFVVLVSEGTTEFVVKYNNITDTSEVITRPGSDIQQLKEQNEFFDIYPNPANSNISLKLKTDSKEEITVQIFDLKGILRAKEKFYLSNSDNKQVEVNIKNLSESIYIVRVMQGSRTFQEKLFLLKK